jgi:GTP-dependent phosphoenolpyruvate carboxykinase
VSAVAVLTTPDQVVWCDGSPQEWQRVTGNVVEAGTLVRLDRKPNSFWCASDPTDVARVEDRTYICSADEADAGPTNNWMNPVDMKVIMTEHYRSSMAGRTMYVIPVCIGPLTAGKPMLGMEIADSEYVVISMHIMTRMGSDALGVACRTPTDRTVVRHHRGQASHCPAGRTRGAQTPPAHHVCGLWLTHARPPTAVRGDQGCVLGKVGNC